MHWRISHKSACSSTQAFENCMALSTKTAATMFTCRSLASAGRSLAPAAETTNERQMRDAQASEKEFKRKENQTCKHRNHFLLVGCCDAEATADPKNGKYFEARCDCKYCHQGIEQKDIRPHLNSNEITAGVERSPTSQQAQIFQVRAKSSSHEAHPTQA